MLIEMVINCFRYGGARRDECKADGKEYVALEDPEIAPYVMGYIIGGVFFTLIFWFIFSSFITGLLLAIFWPFILLAIAFNAGTEDPPPK
jgi:hypothetical protein